MKKHLLFDFEANKKNNTLTIRREFAAGRQLVWDCYTKPEYLSQWFAPSPLTSKTKSMDFRDGGHWHHAMIEPNGTEHWGWTDFVHIQATDYYTSKDAFSDANGKVNSDLPTAHWKVTFTDLGQNTVVETLVNYKSLQDLETVINMGMKEGMISTLERLDDLLEKIS
jgi:uncharacterized protein YndB with AHSA1/START domain